MNNPRCVPKNMGRKQIKYQLRQGSETKSGNYNNVPFDYSQNDKSAKKARTGWFKPHGEIIGQTKNTQANAEVSNKTASAVASDISSGNFDTPTVSLSSISSNVSNMNGTNMTLSGLSNLSSPPSKAPENV